MIKLRSEIADTLPFLSCAFHFIYALKLMKF